MTMADDPVYLQKIRKQFLERLEANKHDYVPDEANLQHPPKTIAITNSKTKDVSPNKIINVMDSLEMLGDDENQDKRLEANKSEYVPDESNLKPPPKIIAITNSKKNYTSPNKVINVMDSLAFWGNEENQDYNSCFAFVAVNYSPKIGKISMLLKSLSFQRTTALPI
jgi:hypothetical protein